MLKSRTILTQFKLVVDKKKLNRLQNFHTQVLASRTGQNRLVDHAPGTDSTFKAKCSKPIPLFKDHQIIRRNLSTQVPRPYVDSKYSYSFGKSNESLLYSTVAQKFNEQVAAKPDDVAFVSAFEGKVITFRELDKDVNKLAKALITRFDVKKGDFVGVFAYNCYNWIVIQLACARIGAILSPINPSYKASELAYVLSFGGVKCLFMPGPDSIQSTLNDHMRNLLSDEIKNLASTGELRLKNVILMDEHKDYKICDGESQDGIKFDLSGCKLNNWSDAQTDGLIFRNQIEAEKAGQSKEEACILDPDSVSPEDPFAIYYTSGTTGRPKGACVSNFTVTNNVQFCQFRVRHGRARDWRISLATCLPMFHIFAGVLLSLAPLFNRSTIVYVSYKYDMKAFVESIIKYQCNLVALTPTMLIDMLSYVEANKLNDIPLQVIQSGGAHLSPEVVSRAFEVLKNLEDIKIGYGSTENGSVATLQTLHEPSESKAITVGPPLDFTEVRVVSPTSEKLVKLGERGEVQTRGFNTMIEYLGQPDKTAEVISPNRWYRTGDIGIMHPHGSLQVCGRSKQMIIKGGENIYPEEVEQLIHRLDYVEDVHVVGVPDKRFGEQVCAWVKLKAGFRGVESAKDKQSEKDISKDELLEYCKDNITYFKVPKYLLFVDEFPMTPTKKVQHHVMTEITCKLMGI